MARPNPVLITGAYGFVGTWLRREFAASCPEIAVVGVGRAYDGAEVMDVTDAASLERTISELHPSAIIHLAAIAAPAEARGDPGRAWHVNVDGSRLLAEAAFRIVPECRFIFVGSSEAYGATFNLVKGAVSESDPLRPVNIYGATKAASDILLGQMAYDGMQVCRFRPFNHTGPGQSDHYVISAFARQIAMIMNGRADRCVRVGNLDAERDFLDVRDVVRAYADAAMTPGGFAPESVYNLASGRARPVREVLDRLISLSGLDIDVAADPARMRVNDIPVACGDASSARRVFGWAPRIDFDMTLRDVLDYWLAETRRG